MYAPGRHQDTPHPYGQMRATSLPTATPYTPATLASIKEYESTIKELQNENWQLKLRIFYLTQSVERFKPEDGFNIKENIEQKVAIEKLQRDLEEKDALLLAARTTIQRYVESETNSLDKTFSDLNEEGYAGEETEEHLHHKKQSDQKQRQLEDENANLREMFQEQSNDMEELVARLETSEERNKELRSTVQSSEEAVADLQEKLNAQESRQISDPNTPRKQALQQKVVTLEEQLAQYDQELQQRSAASDEVDQQMLAEYEETIKFYEQKTKGLEADNVSLLAALQEKDSEAAAALLELKEEHLTAQAQAKQLEEQLEALRAQATAAKQNKLAQRRSEEENHVMKEQLEANLKMMDDYLKMMEQMGTKYKDLQAANKDLIEENRSLREQLTSTPLPVPAVPRGGSDVRSSRSPLTPSLGQQSPLSHTLSFSTVTPSRVSPILPTGVQLRRDENGGATSTSTASAKESRRESKKTERGGDPADTRAGKHRHGDRRRRGNDYYSGEESDEEVDEEERQDERNGNMRPKSKGRRREERSGRDDERRETVRRHRSRGRRSASGSGKAKEEAEREQDYDNNDEDLLQIDDPMEALVQQIRERDDFVCLVALALKELHKTCAQGGSTTGATANDGHGHRWANGGFEFDLSNRFGMNSSSSTGHAREHARPSSTCSSYAFSALPSPRKSSSLALSIRLPPSTRDLDRLSVALTEQKLAMEEAFVLLASLVRKRDAAHQSERERLQQVASKFKYEINSLKMQLKHFKGFYQRGSGGVRGGGSMPRTRSVEAMQMRCGGDESDEEYDDYGAGHDAEDMWRTRDGEDDVTTIFNRLKSKLRKERAADRDYLHQSHDADEEYDRSNQELLWALKEVQTKVERLQESNRVLTMELEEKRGLIEKINSLYKNIPQLLQSPTLPTFSRPTPDFRFLP